MTEPNNNDDSMITFNISGRRFQVLKRTLLDDSKNSENRKTFLHRFAQSSEEERAILTHKYLPDKDQYFFDRNPDVFASVLDFYRHGHLHCPLNMCVEQFLAELEFWNIDPLRISPCCAQKFNLVLPPDESPISIETGTDEAIPMSLSNTDSITPLVKEQPTSKPNHYSVANGDIAVNDSLENPQSKSLRAKVWNFLEEPSSSRPAKMFAIVSVFFVILSVFGLIIGSIPECQVDGEPHPILIVMEYICIGWFTFEYIIRFIVTDKKCAYVVSPLVIIDALAIVPFYLELALNGLGVVSDLDNIRGALLCIRILRVLRVARILRLARYSAGMKSCAETLKTSYREVGMLVIFVCTMIIIFSTTVYFLEKDSPGTVFTSIPATFWWCVVTITTVGYGDMTPQTLGQLTMTAASGASGEAAAVYNAAVSSVTNYKRRIVIMFVFLSNLLVGPLPILLQCRKSRTKGGRLIASLTSISGVIVLAFPITVIVENFYRCYRKEKNDQPPEENCEGPLPHTFGFV